MTLAPSISQLAGKISEVGSLAVKNNGKIGKNLLETKLTDFYDNVIVGGSEVLSNNLKAGFDWLADKYDEDQSSEKKGKD